ncbi:MAG: metallophosphoesterase family protein [Burkholderiaceae bacterium]
MRIAAISDIHGNLPALKAVLADIAAKGADVIVNLGDILSGPLWPREMADLLMAQNFPTIAGNHERQLLDCARKPGGASDQYAFEQTTPAQQAWLAALPKTLWLTADGQVLTAPSPASAGEGWGEGKNIENDGAVFLCHGTPTSDTTYFCETVDSAIESGIRMATQEELQARAGSINAQVMLCGHSHQPRVMAIKDGRLIVNPGSVGIPAYDDDHIAFHIVANGSPHARYCTIERSAHGWNVAQCAVAYDWNAAIAQARRNGREDVALWLTGRA